MIVARKIPVAVMASTAKMPFRVSRRVVKHLKRRVKGFVSIPVADVTKDTFNPVFRSEYCTYLVAEFNFQKLRATTKEDASIEADYIMDMAETMNGDSGHTGTFAECCGFTMTKEVFETEQAAYDWLKDNARKWEVMLGVTVKTTTTSHIYVGGWCNSYF